MGVEKYWNSHCGTVRGVESVAKRPRPAAGAQLGLGNGDFVVKSMNTVL